MTIEGRPTLSNDTYKKYSLENLTTWIHDAMEAASPEEVAQTIIDAIEEDIVYYSQKLNSSQELLKKLRGGQDAGGIRIHYDGWDSAPVSITNHQDPDDIEETSGDVIFISDC